MNPSPPAGPKRRLPVGAEPVIGGAHVRVWAPAARRVSVRLAEGAERALEPEAGGYHAGLIEGAGHGTRYRLSLDGEEPVADPASRFQPEGPTGPSMVIDPAIHPWRDQGWRGVSRADQVLYELHVGTFTQEGTWHAAARKLAKLKDVGVTLIEMMPVHEFPGDFGWGYDGVALFAPAHLYGAPDDLRLFVDAAHAYGLGVILDVVYNHLGPIGNNLKRFSPDYFTPRYTTDWGEAINFDGENSGPVRELIAANAAYWIDEFHLDGLRLDATQNIYDFAGVEDESHEHILALLTRKAREAAGDRPILLIGENEPQMMRLIRSRQQGGLGLDALWNDDFHHSAMVALTGRSEAYYTDYRGSPQELLSAMKRGFLYQGQRYRWQGQPRGTPTTGLRPEQFVAFIQNHDQIANSGRGLRAHRIAGPGRYRAMTALLLLGPCTPMLFQGQEFGASQPFYYFAGFEGELARAVAEGRKKELSQFPSLAAPELQAVMHDPADPATFRACQLDWSEREKNHEAVALHRDLLALRREDTALVASRAPGGTDGAVLGPEAFVLRFFGQDGDDRLLLVNLGHDLELAIMPEPLLAPPEGTDWALLWSSEHPDYGGAGAQSPSPDAPWTLPGHAALLLRPGEPSPQRRSELRKALDQVEKRQ